MEVGTANTESLPTTYINIRCMKELEGERNVLNDGEGCIYAIPYLVLNTGTDLHVEAL